MLLNNNNVSLNNLISLAVAACLIVIITLCLQFWLNTPSSLANAHVIEFFAVY